MPLSGIAAVETTLRFALALVVEPTLVCMNSCMASKSVNSPEFFGPSTRAGRCFFGTIRFGPLKSAEKYPTFEKMVEATPTFEPQGLIARWSDRRGAQLHSACSAVARSVRYVTAHFLKPLSLCLGVSVAGVGCPLRVLALWTPLMHSVLCPSMSVVGAHNAFSMRDRNFCLGNRKTAWPDWRLLCEELGLDRC